MRLLFFICFALTLSACSYNQLVVRASMPLIEGSIHALNRESDLDLAEAAIPSHIELLEGLIYTEPDNIKLRSYATQAYYSFAYGFNEDKRPARAVKFYIRGMQHGFTALSLLGIQNAESLPLNELTLALQKLDASNVATLFWTASNWAKWIDVNRDKPEGSTAAPKAAALMQRSLELDETFYFGGAHIYFGVYYGARAPASGGDFARAESHFNKARHINSNKLLIVDMLQAQYLERQRFDQKKFNALLTHVIEAPNNLDPNMALMNQIAKRKAKNLLGLESSWF